jgi:hypothetical protein
MVVDIGLFGNQQGSANDEDLSSHGDEGLFFLFVFME